MGKSGFDDRTQYTVQRFITIFNLITHTAQ